VELGFDDFDWLAGFLIGLGLEFEVIEPVDLRRHIAALGRRLHRAHPPPVKRASGAS
jgi:predicted DNA-binding transcriptional regulator YafY